MKQKRRITKGNFGLSDEEVRRFSKRWQLVRKREDKLSRSRNEATKFWKRCVGKLGVHLARTIMLEIMGNKKSGPSLTGERSALRGFIGREIMRSNSNVSDEKIAQRILKSEPHYFCYRRVFLKSDWQIVPQIKGPRAKTVLRDDAKDRSIPDDFVLDVVQVITKGSIKTQLSEIQSAKVKPIGRGLAALKKQVSRIRREMIEEGWLPAEYAPKQYYRD